MKKILFVLTMGVLLPLAVSAQMDTVQWNCAEYHRSIWYDTLPEFYSYWNNDSTLPSLGLYSYEGGIHAMVPVVPQYVDGPTQIYGVAVAVQGSFNSNEESGFMHIPSYDIRYNQFTAEYVYLFQKVGDSIVLRDSARWDTVTPKIMKVALNADTLLHGFRHVMVYEAMFKAPILVDSVFYTASSDNGGIYPSSIFCGYEYYPVLPILVTKRNVPYFQEWCPKPSWWSWMRWSPRTREWYYYQPTPLGPYVAVEFWFQFPIVDYVELIVTSADTTMGTAGPVRHVARNTTQTIYATPKRGHRFSHWREDGGIHAIRSVYISQDTTRFTAVFEPLESYRVEASVNDESMGSVTVDDSIHYEGEEALFEAIPNGRQYRFTHWSNGSTDNPLSIEVSSDTLLTAYFEPTPVYTVTVRSNNEAMGYTMGDSTYYEGDEAVLAAVPLGENRFERWTDGDTANPRYVVVTQDTAFTAQFVEPEPPEGVATADGAGITFRLLPNPASGSVLCVFDREAIAGGVLAMTDATGRELMRHELAPLTTSLRLDLSALPAGTYFVTLATPQGSSTQKLILE
ncbi:MAG: T9SS type A sorting domain-containing protein [Bacteroidales bacterium]|nr:T9SS type A sorting domain-containing protein [Bacteroidales bacterium]